MFTFNISLSVLNHLGRNLYRNFSTVLGEAISNAWDADATNVYITIDRDNNYFSILDDGQGMSADDFQTKFLRVGYSKRNALGTNLSQKRRPFIGRKGIGKLALLSCSEKVSIFTKTQDGQIIGGVINNTDLDNAITDSESYYTLGELADLDLQHQLNLIPHGTLLVFENLRAPIFNSIEYLRTVIAMYFRFSTIQSDGIDANFHIFVNNEEISTEDLSDLVSNTEFIWKINTINNDPLVDQICSSQHTICESVDFHPNRELSTVNGFIATVNKPSNIKIRGTDETVSLDLFVNGRLREKDILRHIKTNRIMDSYLYGQINYNSLDDDIDRFTSSRESVKSDDPKFKELLTNLKNQVIAHILERWDILRDSRGKDGDPDNTRRMSKKARKSKELFNATLEEYEVQSQHSSSSPVDSWLQKLGEEAKYNFPSYAECFVSENLVRHYIQHNAIPISDSVQNQINDKKRTEQRNKESCGMSIPIRQSVYNNDSEYLAMDVLANIAEPGAAGLLCSLQQQARSFKPIRDALMHTSFLTQDAKVRLTSIFNDIRARVKNLLANEG